MTEKVNPSPNRPAEAFKTAGAIAYGGTTGGFVVDSNSPTDIAKQDSGIDETALNAFSETHTSSSLDVTIEGGESFIFGSWVCVDTSTTINLAPSTNDQTVYLGWNKDSANDVIVGLNEAFSNVSDDTDKRIALYSFDTGSGGVTSVIDERTIGSSISVEGEQTFGTNSEVTLSYDPVDDDFEINGADLTSTGVTIVDESAEHIPQVSLENDSLTVEGNTVSLGGSTSINHNNLSAISSNDHHSRYSDEEAQDAVAAILNGSGNVSISYNDSANTLSVDTSALDTEEVQDTVSSLVASDSNLSWSYDDGNNTLTISLAGSISVNDIEVGGFDFIGEFQTLSDFDTAASSGDRGYITEEQQFARQP
jgi:hypothetical protein